MRRFLLPVLLLASAALTAAEHPRLLFSAAELPALRAKVKEAPFTAMVDRLRADLDTNNWGTDPANPKASYDQAAVGLRAAFLYALTGDDALARKARTLVEGQLADAKNWANGRTKGLALFMHGSRVALCYDWCHGAPSWDAEFSAKVSRELKRHGEIVVRSGGSEQNTNPASNWQGSRFAAGGLCLLATDETVETKDLDNCYNRVARYLRENLGSGKESRGWNTEGLGYTYFPMGNYVCPFAEAMLRHDPAKDLRKACGGAEWTLWTCSAAIVKTSLGLLRPDFGDDNPGANAEGCMGWAFRWCPSELQPGLAWVYDRTVGAAGDKTYDRSRFGTIASILYHPGTEVAPRDPLTIPEWREGFDDRGGNGIFTFRNAYQGVDDVCLQLNAKLIGDRGHSGPDSLSFRLVGANALWGTGGGRYGKKTGGIDAYWRSQNTVYPGDPDGKVTTNGEKGRVLGGAVAEDGSGWLSLAGTNNVGTANLRRLVACDWKRNGSLGAIVISDLSDNGRFWQMCTTADNTVTIAGNRFTISAPGGYTLQGTVLHPADAKLATGTRIRGSSVTPSLNENRWVTAEGDGAFLVALTIAGPKGTHPAASADGAWNGTRKGEVTVGGWKVAIDGDAVADK